MNSMCLTLFPAALKGPLLKWLMLYQRIQSESEFTDALTVQICLQPVVFVYCIFRHDHRHGGLVAKAYMKFCHH